MPEAKQETLKLRVTDRQKRLFESAAAMEGLTLSEWIRRLGLMRAGELAIRCPAEGRR